MEHLKDLFAIFGVAYSAVVVSWALIVSGRYLTSAAQRRKDRNRDLSRVEAARRIGSFLRSNCAMIEWRPDAMLAMDLIGASLTACDDFDELDLGRRFAKELPPLPPEPATDSLQPALTYWTNPADGADCHVSLFGIRVRDIDDLHDGDKVTEIERRYRERVSVTRASAETALDALREILTKLIAGFPSTEFTMGDISGAPRLRALPRHVPLDVVVGMLRAKIAELEKGRVL